MSLNDIVNELDKQASNQNNNSGNVDNSGYTEEQIKEAYAAGRVTGAAFADRIQDLEHNTNA